MKGIRKRVELFKILKENLIKRADNGDEFNLCLCTAELHFKGKINPTEELYLDNRIFNHAKKRGYTFDDTGERDDSIDRMLYVWKPDDLESRIKWVDAQIKKYSYEK